MMCEEYIRGKKHELGLVLEYSIVYGDRLLPTLMSVSKKVLVGNEKETESLMYPYQTIKFSCKFNLILLRLIDIKGNYSNPILEIRNRVILFIFNKNKMFFKLRNLTEEKTKR